jgi:hypothetical protein
MAPSQSKSRNYVWTLNNYTPEEEKQIISCASSSQFTYVTFGRESGDEGTPHLQGYCELAGARTGSWLKRQPGFARVHYETRRGTSEEARTYCQKDGDFFEAGTARQSRRQRSRTDLAEVKEAIDEGKSELYVAEHYFSQWVQYRRSFKAYYELRRAAKRSWKSFVNVIWGGTGLGKTRFVYQQHPDDDIWVYPGRGWFDGYSGQRIALFDDFRGDLEISTLLQVLDRYPLDVPIKGGHVNWNPRRIYITSNVMPALWYESLDGESRAALFRRLDRIDVVNENIFEN